MGTSPRPSQIGTFTRFVTSTLTALLVVGLVSSLTLPAGAELPPGGTFSDDDGNTHEGNIEAIAAEEITRGCNPPLNDRYCPDDPVTRGEMAAFIRRALKIPDTNTNHFDDDNGSTFEADIDAIAQSGITQGCNPPTNTRYCPNDPVKRDQMASFLARARNLNPIFPPPPTKLTGARISPGQSIQAAVNAHPEGTTFILTAGIHTISSPIVPKKAQKFIGEERPTLSGNGQTEYAFKGEAAPGVEIRGLIIERFASRQNGHGTIHAGHGWTIADNEIRHNTGAGIFHEQDTLVTGNRIHHNGWYGLGGFKAHGSVIENNEVYENGGNGWPDSAGSKWVGAIGLRVSNNYYHNNHNNGIWLDTDHKDSVVERNRIENNYDKGLHFEASCSGVLRNNEISGNGVGIMLVASQNTNVYGNKLSGNDQTIRVGHLDRGQGEHCDRTLNNVQVHDNGVKSGDVILAEYGPVPDPGAIFAPGDSRVVFDKNTYVGTTFHFDGQVSWGQWQAAGNDPHGSFSP